MFDNMINQASASLVAEDIRNGRFPGAVLFAGPSSSGKMTCALETARILSCGNGGAEDCGCQSCMQYRTLSAQNLIIVGSGNRSVEIAAARRTLDTLSQKNSRHLEEGRLLYINAVRKLTLRFSEVLWEGEDKFSKFSNHLEKINECLEQILPGRSLPDDDVLSSVLDEIQSNAEKLEDSFLYDSIPVAQIRNFSSWARLTSTGRKILVIENADAMAESARNALLKILEEPPEDTYFILTTTSRGAMLPTILSRVRTYTFTERPAGTQQEILSKIFHYMPPFGEEMPSSVSGYLQSFFPVKQDVIRNAALKFFGDISEGHVPDIKSVCDQCNSFEPRLIFRNFIQEIMVMQRKGLCLHAGAECAAMVVEELRHTYSSVKFFNQNPQSALEELTRSLMQINYVNGGILRKVREIPENRA